VDNDMSAQLPDQLHKLQYVHARVIAIQVTNDDYAFYTSAGKIIKTKIKLHQECV